MNNTSRGSSIGKFTAIFITLLIVYVVNDVTEFFFFPYLDFVWVHAPSLSLGVFEK